MSDKCPKCGAEATYSGKYGVHFKCDSKLLLKYPLVESGELFREDKCCLYRQLAQRDASIAVIREGLMTAMQEVEDLHAENERLRADIEEIWQWAKMVWGDSSDFPYCIQKAGQYYKPEAAQAGERMSKAQRLSDELRTSDDYDFLECEILPLFDAVDELQESHDRLLKVCEKASERLRIHSDTAALNIYCQLREAIEKARIKEPERLTRPRTERIDDMGGAAEMTWIQTYRGLKIDFLNPSPDQIHIGDIAIALSRMPRFTGHTVRYLSVAEHSCMVSDECSDEHRLVGLAHDFTEAYIGDISKPLKATIGNAIVEIEDRLWRAIAIRFGLPESIPEEVKYVDARMLFTEKRQNMDVGPEWGWRMEPYTTSVQCWSPQRAYRELMDRWFRLKGDC